eukprot:9119911-Prorocentrum_lima.AAC.1
MKDGFETSDLCNTTVPTNMFQLKVANHIRLGCGLASSHPEVLELKLLCATFIIKLDRRIH